jgi:hypothetical protein
LSAGLLLLGHQHDSGAEAARLAAEAEYEAALERRRREVNFASICPAAPLHAFVTASLAIIKTSVDPLLLLLSSLETCLGSSLGSVALSMPSGSVFCMPMREPCQPQSATVAPPVCVSPGAFQSAGHLCRTHFYLCALWFVNS